MLDVKLLELKNGKAPYSIWFNCLPTTTQYRIDAYLGRFIRAGQNKNTKYLNDGVYELKLNFGPGYRIYFGYEDFKTIILLLGGDKGRQKQDIKKAKKYWRDYYA